MTGFYLPAHAGGNRYGRGHGLNRYLALSLTTSRKVAKVERCKTKIWTFPQGQVLAVACGDEEYLICLWHWSSTSVIW